MKLLQPAILSILLAVFCLFSGAAAARECTCKDLPTIRRRAQKAGIAEAAWKQVFAWAKGLRQNPPLPTSNRDLNVKFVELMGASPSNWDAIMSQPSSDAAAEPAKIGGLNSKGEPIIDEKFEQANCDIILEGVRLHEATHKDFFLAFSLSRFASILMPSNLLWLRAESEVEAYRAEKEFLAKKAKELEKAKKCKKPYRASGQYRSLAFSGVICSLEQPFTVKGQSMLEFKFNFTPSSETNGSVAISVSGHGITGTGSGTYAVEGVETEQAKIAVTATYTGIHQIGSAMGSGPLTIDLAPLEGSECEATGP